MKKYRLAVVLFLSGCAFDTFDKALPLLKGEKIDVAVEYLGPPDQQQKFGDKKFYTWQRMINTTVTSPVTTQSNGWIGNTNVWGSTTSWQAQPVTYRCKIQLQTNKSNIIQDFSYDGNDGGCTFYQDSFEKLLNDYSRATVKK